MWTANVAGQLNEELFEQVRHAITPWAMESSHIDLPYNDSCSFERTGTNPGMRTVTLHEVDDPCGIFVDVEDDDGQGAVWGVQIRLAFCGEQMIAWIDNTLESETVEVPISIGRPRVVDELLGIGTKPKLGTSAILSAHQDIPDNAVTVLSDLLNEPKRGLPVVVVTCPRSGFTTTMRKTVISLAKRLTGLATVVTLDSSAQDALKAVLPERLGVWGGAIRVYSTTVLDSPAAHRIYSGDFLRQRGVDPVVNWVTAMSSRRRPELQVRRLDRAGRALDSGAVVGELEELKLERDLIQEALDNEILERVEIEAELNKALDMVRRLRRLGFENDQASAMFFVEQDAEDEGNSLMTVSEAVTRAREELADVLSIPNSVERELDRVDTAPNALAWGNTTWRGLKALAEYALDVRRGVYSGGFWNWCVRGGMWPATDKKLAMVESNTVRMTDKYAKKRWFEVDSLVDSKGIVFMESHLKVSEGGGDLAPRIYFYDDTAGATRRVHIGFVGPHYLVPNTRS